MPTYKIFGKIEPYWFKLNLEFQPTLGYRLDEIGLDLSCTISIKDSDVVAVCDASTWTEDVLSHSLRYIFDWVSAEVDLFAFSTGKLLTVVLESIEDPSGARTQLLFQAPQLAALATACRVTGGSLEVRTEIREALRVVLAEPGAMLALRDLVAAIRYGNNSLSNCARAVESLRRALWGKDDSGKNEREEAWAHLRDTLHVSRAYLQAITDASVAPRHGSTAYVSAAAKEDVLRRTWVVMNRFLLYRLGGNVPLDKVVNPVL